MVSTTVFDTTTSTAPARLEPDTQPAGAPPTGPAPANESPLFRRRRWALVVALVAALLAAGVVAYSVTRTMQIDLTVDGETRSLDTRADSVADVLADEGIAVTDGDLVQPSVDAELANGDTIVIRFARPLTVMLDGSETTVETTELTVGDALEAADIAVEGAAVEPPLTAEVPRTGATVEIVTPKSVVLNVGGQPLTVVSTAATVGEALEAEGVVLADTDTVEPALDTPVTEGLSAVVTRIRVEQDTRTEPIAHETVEQDDSEMTVGDRRVVTEGVDGVQEVTYDITYTNDQPTSEEVAATVVTQEPVTEVVAVGTKPRPTPAVDPGASAGGEAAGLNWAALAECESSGNPRAVNPAGYYGLYQFSLPTWASVGGSGNPADASPAEQTNRAHILYNRSGPGQWPTCGKHLFE